jgi:hypothetical protein
LASIPGIKQLKHWPLNSTELGTMQPYTYSHIYLLGMDWWTARAFTFQYVCSASWTHAADCDLNTCPGCGTHIRCADIWLKEFILNLTYGMVQHKGDHLLMAR